MYVLLANSVALFHLLYVVIVISLVPLILIGRWRGWSWVSNFWIRVLHLIMIGVVVLEVACGWTCPLSIWEKELRIAGGQMELQYEPDGTTILDRLGQPQARLFQSYRDDFIVKIMNTYFYVDRDQLSPVILSTIYVIFGGLVLAMLILVPPRWPWRQAKPVPHAGPPQT
ncbi:MAG: DUF2784 family protein [Gemmatales bacterium]